MTNTDFVDTYKKEFIDRGMDRLDVFRVVSRSFDVKHALYLGSHIHIAPSLVFPDVTYVDSYKRAVKLFDDKQSVAEYIDGHKEYSEKSTFEFIGQDYTAPLNIGKDFDLLISQYAGFVSQAGKGYLKSGGLLLANDSHGDASMAYLDDDYVLVGVISDGEYMSVADNHSYFKLKSGKVTTMDELQRTGRGPKYLVMAQNYMFRKRVYVL